MDALSQSINYNNEDHNTYEDEEQMLNVKRISIPADRVKDFIHLLYGDREILILNSNTHSNYLDLTNRSVIVL